MRDLYLYFHLTAITITAGNAKFDKAIDIRHAYKFCMKCFFED